MRFFISRRQFKFISATLVALAVAPSSFGADGPRLVQKDGRYALMVDGRPYLILGGQIHNSSAWPIELGRYGNRWLLCTRTRWRLRFTGNRLNPKRATQSLPDSSASLLQMLPPHQLEIVCA